MANLDVCPEASKVFTKLSQYPPTVDDDDLETLEKFVATMYDKSGITAGVDDARLHMFARKQRFYKAIPPNQAALLQHTNRAAYEAGCIGASQHCTNQKHRVLLTGAGQRRVICGRSSIAERFQQLTKCRCKSECCVGRFKCYRFGLSCTALYSCSR